MVSRDEALEQHKKYRGKIETLGKVRLDTKDELSTYYTPGVAYVSLAIKEDKATVYDYTTKANTIAIVTDGTRILGLGDVGPEAGLPVMEGKALLFKKFGGVDAVPLCINTKDEDEIVKFVQSIAPTFGGINIEDIKAPKSFNVVDRLSASLDIPVFHDDQQGTGSIVVAGLLNSFKLAKKEIKDAKIVINGSGSAGVGVAKMLHAFGVKKIYVLDTKGLIYEGREEDMSGIKDTIAKMSNPEKKSGTLETAVEGADALVGLSAKGVFNEAMIKKMASKPIVFALANPDPEISYEEGRAAGAFIVATGRSDKPNQINNSLAFPGIMRGLLDVRAIKVNDEILKAVTKAIANSVGKKLSVEHIVPDITAAKDAIKLESSIAEAVARAAIESNVARIKVDPKVVKKNTAALLKRYNSIEKKVAKLSIDKYLL